jgi:sushi domain-containing protein 2
MYIFILMLSTDGANLPLMFAPESGNMLGGTVVNITGPCFNLNDRITCRFDTESVIGAVVDVNRAICVQPRFYHNGYARLEVAINNEPFKWKGKFFVGKAKLTLLFRITTHFTWKRNKIIT